MIFDGYDIHPFLQVLVVPAQVCKRVILREDFGRCESELRFQVGTETQIRLARAGDWFATLLIAFGLYVFEYFDSIDFPLLGYCCLGLSLLWFLTRYVVWGKVVPFSSVRKPQWSDGLQRNNLDKRKEPKI